MRAATSLASIGVSRPIYHLFTSNDAILILQTIIIMLLPYVYTI